MHNWGAACVQFSDWTVGFSCTIEKAKIQHGVAMIVNNIHVKRGSGSDALCPSSVPGYNCM